MSSFLAAMLILLAYAFVIAGAFVPVVNASSSSTDQDSGIIGQNHRRTTTRQWMLPEPCDSFFSSIASAYTTSLEVNPMPTKSMTSAILCGLGDYLAQRRDPSISNTDWNRLAKFSIKGLGGGIIWAIWYDTADRIVDLLIDSMSFAESSGSMTSNLKVLLSVALEQFFWCPLMFGLWEIPVASLMNGGKLSAIRGEVEQKLGGLLVDNAKVWTPANLLIYSAPLEYRAGLGNLVDVFWQSIVADVAADCGDVSRSKTNDPGVSIVKDYLDTQRKEGAPKPTSKSFVKRAKGVQLK